MASRSQLASVLGEISNFMQNGFQVINFYEFKPLGDADALDSLKIRLKDLLIKHTIFGTIIISVEGFNGSLCGEVERIEPFLSDLEQILQTRIESKSSFHDASPFRKHEIKIKPEIVTLKRQVDISMGDGTHVEPKEWNSIISDPDVYLLDTRNDYEFLSGTFRNAVNPKTEKFSELPEFIEKELDPAKHKKIAMFCTGGIRCEKFAPYMRERGFENIYQLKGGILKYLEEVPESESLWDGECFVFDERITVNEKLEKGSCHDYSSRHSPVAMDHED